MKEEFCERFFWWSGGLEERLKGDSGYSNLVLRGFIFFVIIARFWKGYSGIN